MRGFKIAKGKLGRAVRTARKRIEDLERRRATMPRRVPRRDVVSGDVVKLAVPLALLAPIGVHLIFAKLLRVPLPIGLIPMPW